MLTKMAQQARSAARVVALLSEDQKNNILTDIADQLAANISALVEINQEDVEEARKAEMSEQMIDRLILTENRLKSIIADLRRVTELPDPVGEEFDE